MTEVGDVRGSGEVLALQVSATVDVDPRSGGRTCAECGPHGGRGRVCLLYSWVDCVACEELERMMAHARADDLVYSHARGRRPAPGALRVEVDRLAPGRWSIHAVVRAWDVPPPETCWSAMTPEELDDLMRASATALGVPLKVLTGAP